MIVASDVIVGATLGAIAAVHCAAMCGPLVVGGCMRSGAMNRRAVVEYGVGRLLSYATIGAFAGVLGRPLATGHAGVVVQSIASLGVALYLVARAIGWISRRRADAQLVAAETLVRRPPGFLARFASIVPKRGLGLGLATGIFPCGALMTGVVAAALTGSPLRGAITMTAFALASFPALVAAALLGDRIVHAAARASRPMRAAMSVVLVGVAGWIAVGVVRRLVPSHEAPPCCHVR